MRYEFHVPDIGEGLTEAEVVKWCVNIGDTISEDDPLCELQTDKAVVEVTSPCKGTVVELNGTLGEMLKVGSVMVVFETEAAQSQSKQDTQGNKPTSSESNAPDVAQTAIANDHKPSSNKDVRATPSTRRFARERGIDLSQVQGTGVGGRVLRLDVERLGEVNGPNAIGFGKVDTSAVSLRVAPTVIPHAQDQQRIPIKGMRRAIAETMVRSVAIIPHATSGFRCNADRFVALRPKLQELLGVRISFTAMVVKAMIPALKLYPYFNASVDDVSNEIVVHGEINIGFAAHTEDGLMVPVIKNADQKSLAEISSDIDRLAGLARERKISRDDIRGSTITLSNVGSHGSHDLLGRPIINHPQAAIIAMTRIKPQPVAENGQVVVQQTLEMVTSYDHRIIDGVYAAQFMESMISVIEEPGILLSK